MKKSKKKNFKKSGKKGEKVFKELYSINTNVKKKCLSSSKSNQKISKKNIYD